MFTHYDRIRIANLCEKASLLQRVCRASQYKLLLTNPPLLPIGPTLSVLSFIPLDFHPT
jgi:hypothetical protein